MLIQRFSSTFTFWRFPIQVPLDRYEMKIQYNVNHGQWLDFYVPGRHQNMRWAAYSVGAILSWIRFLVC